MEPGSWAKCPAFQAGRSGLLAAGEDVKVDWPHAHVYAPYMRVCVSLVLPAWVNYRCFTTAPRLPLPLPSGVTGGS